jgi:3-phosphoshikimate 1-carboxyvinyltransferase
MAAVRFAPSGPVRGTLRPPPDKSISHRAAIVAAMGTGEAAIEGYLDAADCRSTLAAMEALGARVSELRPSEGGTDAIDLRVQGIGLAGPGEHAGAEPLAIDVGNAGTLLRILPGWLAGQRRGAWVLDGDASIRRRPVDRVADPLRSMGGSLECRDGRLPPLAVDGAELRGTSHRLAVASAQVKSCLLLAGLLASGASEVVEPAPSRDHTERMLVACGVPLTSERAGPPVAVSGALPGRRIVVEPVKRLELGRVAVPGDLSSAAFLLVAALLVRGSELRIEGVGLNPTRVGLLGILNRMRAPIEIEEGIPVGGEPRGAIRARHGGLTGTRVGGGEVPLAIDELPLVALVACFADGETVLTGAGELRHKESDRIATVVEGLRGLGAEIETSDEGFAVHGTGGLRGGVLDSAGDHRMAMLGAVAGLASEAGVEVRGFESAAVSYPSFERDLRRLIGGSS